MQTGELGSSSGQQETLYARIRLSVTAAHRLLPRCASAMHWRIRSTIITSYRIRSMLSQAIPVQTHFQLIFPMVEITGTNMTLPLKGAVTQIMIVFVTRLMFL